MTAGSGQILSHYRLLEKIGEGGMGVVWKAEDTILGRPVAIKVLPADVALDEKRRQMFLDEARLASSLSDARIAQVHELGREAGLDFIVMEFVEGKPLSRVLHGRPLPPEKVASLGEQVAKALSRAHRKGLLHRDLKPANILVTADGEVKVVDFGLATLFSGPVSTRRTDATTRGADAATLTPATRPPGDASQAAVPRAGAIAGTLPYMSPEQVKGEPLDARSDIFSLGTVLYEMTTGQRPFAAATHAELMTEILKSRPVPVHDLVPKVPLDLERMIQKAMAPRRGDRFQTMDDLAVDLKHLGRELESGSSPSYDALHETAAWPGSWRKLALRTLAGAGVMAAIAVALWLAVSRPPGGAAALDARTALILPFEVLGQAEGADYVGRAFAEGLAVNLARAGTLKILPVPPSVPTEQPPARIAREMGAGRVLSGSLTRRGDSLLASISLIDAAENAVVWGVQRMMGEEQMPALASALAREIVREVGGEFPNLYDTPENALRNSALATSPLASEALGALRRHEVQAELNATRRLVEAFPGVREALAVRVHALAEAWSWHKDLASRPALDEAVAALQRVDPVHPQIEVTHGFVESGQGRSRESISRFTGLLDRTDLTSDLRAEILRSRGWDENIVDDLDASIRDLEEAAWLSPTNGPIFAILSNSLRQAGRPEEALVRSEQAVALSPFDHDAQQSLGMVLGVLGRWAEAATAAERACELARNQSNCAVHAVTQLEAGRKSEALEVARQAENQTEDLTGPYNLACFWARAGNRSEALRFLRRSLEIGLSAPWMARDPDLASLYGDPEFQALAAEVERRAGEGK